MKTLYAGIEDSQPAITLYKNWQWQFIILKITKRKCMCDHTYNWQMTLTKIKLTSLIHIYICIYIYPQVFYELSFRLVGVICQFTHMDWCTAMFSSKYIVILYRCCWSHIRIINIYVFWVTYKQVCISMYTYYSAFYSWNMVGRFTFQIVWIGRLNIV